MSSRPSPRRLAVIGAATLALLCGAGFAIGAHAAFGDHDGPAVLMAHPGVLPWERDAVSSRPGDGEPRQIDAAPGTDPTDPPGATAEPTPSPGPTPNPSTPPTPAPAPGPTPGPSPDETPAPTPTPAPTHPPVSTDPTDPMSPKYNPYTTPGDPAYVTDDAKSAWLGRQTVVRQCMTDAGFDYLDWLWWEGGSPMPQGLDADAEAAWMHALRGDGSQEGDWQSAGCEGAAWHAADEAAAAGAPLTAPVPPPSTGPTPRERWLGFQDAVRACMTDAGYEYRYWEFWNPAYAGTDGPAAMPPGLDDAQRAAWTTAAFGSPDGSGGSLDGGGCWTTGADATGYAEFG
ncbi:hypothetical protein FLP10_09840 [Agromyces intestinalis]|uniref:Uncharacterized protein n=1 Tax=Agromyces intestinalis TaxID=2592652 RepID=A0A5C1YEX6_9MICO|nr:hypothetical protein [Agromyces intestinalis]QEO14676.1 hypothetical protein FLP10_09840 [Agromyces intestinalis]